MKCQSNSTEILWLEIRHKEQNLQTCLFLGVLCHINSYLTATVHKSMFPGLFLTSTWTLPVHYPDIGILYFSLKLSQKSAHNGPKIRLSFLQFNLDHTLAVTSNLSCQMQKLTFYTIDTHFDASTTDSF